jgi:peptidoglycan/LPS O-acetylase OafA/YrhL
MFLALGSLRRRWALVLMAAAFASGLGLLLWQSGSAYARLYFVSLFAPSRFLEFLAGVFLARVFFTASKEKLEASSGLAQLAGIALIVAGANYRAHAPWPLWGGLLYVPGSALLVLGLAYGRGFFVAHLSRPWLNRLGMASYSLYMIHAPILRAVKGVCMRVGWEVTTAPGFWVVAAGLFVVVQAGALIMCFAYEIPLQRRLRSLLTFPAGLAAAYAGQNQDLSGQRKS